MRVWRRLRLPVLLSSRLRKARTGGQRVGGRRCTPGRPRALRAGLSSAHLLPLHAACTLLGHRRRLLLHFWTAPPPLCSKPALAASKVHVAVRVWRRLGLLSSSVTSLCRRRGGRDLGCRHQRILSTRSSSGGAAGGAAAAARLTAHPSTNRTGQPLSSPPRAARASHCLRAQPALRAAPLSVAGSGHRDRGSVKSAGR